MGITAGRRKALRGDVEQVGAVHAWLVKNVKRIKTVGRYRTSYGIKHLAEPELGYITNGAFIAAALIAEYPAKFDPDSPNVRFGMSERSLRLLERQLYPGMRQ